MRKDYLAKIDKALGVDPIATQTQAGDHPALALVIFSRTHFKPFHKPYGETRAEIDQLIASAAFETRLYQLNDLHPDQARQSIWQLRRDDVAMRVEVVPNNAITIAFFSCDNPRSGLHLARRALIPPR